MEQLLELLHKQAMENLQRSKIKRLTQGDRASHFFHAKFFESENSPTKKLMLDLQRDWTNSNDNLNREAIHYFSNLFNSSNLKQKFSSPIICKKTFQRTLGSIGQAI